MRTTGLLGAIFSAGLLLGSALAQQGSKDRGWEVRSFGACTLPLELGGQTERATVIGAKVQAGAYEQVPDIEKA